MKTKIFAAPFVLLFALVVLTSAHPVASSFETKLTALESKLSLSNMSVENFLKLSKSDLKELNGGSITFKERLVFKQLQSELRKEVKLEKIKSSDLINIESLAEERGSQFKIGGFILGFLLGLIGVALAHIFSQDKGFRRSSWQGLGAWIILLLIRVLV